MEQSSHNELVPINHSELSTINGRRRFLQMGSNLAIAGAGTLTAAGALLTSKNAFAKAPIITRVGDVPPPGYVKKGSVYQGTSKFQGGYNITVMEYWTRLGKFTCDTNCYQVINTYYDDNREIHTYYDKLTSAIFNDITTDSPELTLFRGGKLFESHEFSSFSKAGCHSRKLRGNALDQELMLAACPAGSVRRHSYLAARFFEAIPYVMWVTYEVNRTMYYRFVKYSRRSFHKFEVSQPLKIKEPFDNIKITNALSLIDQYNMAIRNAYLVGTSSFTTAGPTSGYAISYFAGSTNNTSLALVGGLCIAVAAGYTGFSHGVFQAATHVRAIDAFMEAEMVFDELEMGADVLKTCAAVAFGG